MVCQSHGPVQPFDRSLATWSSLLDEAGRLSGIPAGSLAIVRGKIEERAFNVVVAGEFKRGKSSIVNALLGADVLPTAVVPLTSVVTLVRHAAVPSVQVVFSNGGSRAVDLAALPEYVSERGNPGNAKGVREVVVGFPAPWLAGGVRLVDTPGIGSVHQHNTQATLDYIPQADAVLFVASVDQPLSRNELDFLAEIRLHAGKVFCLLNKIDYLSEKELAESLAFASAVLHASLGESVPIFPVSARLALQGRVAGDAAALARSRLPAFDAALHAFLTHERDAVWMRSVRRQFLRLLDEARLAAELESRALSSPMEQLDAKLEALAAKRIEIIGAKSDVDALLEAQGRELLKKRVEPDIDAFKRGLSRTVEAALGTWYAQLRSQGSAVLQAGLEERLIAQVREAFDTWRASEDAQVSQAFDELCARLSRRLEEAIEELLQFAAELFAIPFTPGAVESAWQSRSAFRYKFWSEPPSLMLMRNALVRFLPAAIGHPLILRDARSHAVDLVEMQAGRVRHDFEERIKRNTAEFRRDMAERVDETIASIHGAIEQAKRLRTHGEAGTLARREQLAAMLASLRTLCERAQEAS